MSSSSGYRTVHGMELRAAGGVISANEMIIYELLRSSGTEEFKKMPT